jgi:hypothetical protein
MGARKEDRPSVGRGEGGANPQRSPWLGPAGWRLPGGETLAEFASKSGFVAPRLLGALTLCPRRAGPAVVKGAG